jgi:ketol-acid reductoisomerase
MVAPKGPGTTLRERFVQGLGIPCLFALHQEVPKGDAQAIGLAWAHGIGCARAGVIYTTFRNETETDLFGEQAVLCGGMTGLVMAAFETLVAAGYPPELAYLECCHEVKQIADLVYERGLAGMMEAISNTAEFGAYQAAPIIVDQHVRDRLKALLERIQDGAFAKEFHRDHERGFKWFKQQREALKQHSIEPAGEVIRSLMPRTDEQRGSESV